MTELHHFHPARKGSGSLRPFPIYPLYTQAEILSLDKPIADCFSFSSSEKLRKAQEMQSYQRFQHIGRTAFNTSGANAPRSLSRAKAGHTRLCQQDRTQGLTRRNRGISDGGAISTLGPFCAVRNPCVAGT